MNTSCSLPINLTTDEKCALIKENSGPCEGGGYVDYTALVLCQEPGEWQWVLVGSIVWLLILFLAVSVAADEFFAPNIASIVTLLNISENIAGVTLLAFGNGAPDIFSSMASVLGDEEPKVGLAIGGLAGAGIFVTTVVVASMVLVKPFEVMRRPLMRDISFYVLAVFWTLLVFTHDTLHLWGTLGFIGIYAIFVLFVILSRIFGQRFDWEPSFLPAKESRATLGKTATLPISAVSDGKVNGSFFINNGFTSDSTNNVSVPVSEEKKEQDFDGSFFGAPSVSVVPILKHPDLDGDMTIPTACSRITAVYKDFLTAVSPITEKEWKGNLLKRIFAIIKAPIILILKLTIPQSENQWSKVLALVHCFTCPLFAIIATQQITFSPTQGWPGLWAHALVIGILPAVFILIFTSFLQEPRFFKQCSSFVGFVMAVLWIYSLANEVVGVLTMIGVVSGLSHEVLGLTLLAWSNSLGDLVGDISVARKGFPKMGISAAFGAPLTNLLIGFGMPFTIAVLRSPKLLSVLLGFLTVSLISSLILLPVQRFFLRRWYAVYLIVLYIAFIVVVVLTQLGVLFG